MDAAELTAILHEVRDRVRARNPQTSAGGLGIPLADLLPVVHARDAALGKVAAIGQVNPRPGGLVNTLVQNWKRLVSRVLDWHVREQVEFNRNMVACVDALVESINDTNRALVEMGKRIAEANARLEEAKDIRSHWADWHREWEQKLTYNEIQFLRSVGDLQAGFQHRTSLMEANLREQIDVQHRNYLGALERANIDIQQRLWADLERIRAQYEALIHSELRTARQRAQITAATAAPAPAAQAAPEAPQFDYGRFAERFRGTEDYVKRGQQIYRPYFAGRSAVLDIGCGRGEFLEMMREMGVAARGLDLDPESVATCRAKGLDAEAADLFTWLADAAEGSLDGIFCSQVVEHLPVARLPEFVRLAARALRRDGVIAVETPNPECLAIFATHFYLDPTHTRPVPHPLLSFLFQEMGLGLIEVHKLAPATDSMPALALLPAEFRDAFFGGLDYSIIARKL